MCRREGLTGVSCGEFRLEGRGEMEGVVCVAQPSPNLGQFW